ncbi:MAG: ubiquinone biosynthesis regulatory protein kinase UbiB [Pseudomonadota bacterium]
MMPLRQARRLLRIGTVLARYRLDEYLLAVPGFSALRYVRVLSPWGRRHVSEFGRGKRLRLALQELGPIFVKFGQVLSTRRDLLPDDIAEELALLQDQVEPFPGDQAVVSIERSLGESIATHFDDFDATALASASVAQVHSAKLKDGRQVVLKVLRPGIRETIEEDVGLIQLIAKLARRYHPSGHLLRPEEIAGEFEKTIFNELDLQREAASASQLKRNFEGSPELRVPEIHWALTKGDVLTMERVFGIPIDDLDALQAANVDIKLLAERGIRIFYTQVFRDNYFHADMHPGNILVDATDPADPTYIALDFGIMGSLPPAHYHFLAENFLAFFAQDYGRVAALHIEAGWVPDTVRVDELEQAVRTVSEPQFARSLSEISFAEVLLQLFAVARQFDLIVQPELVLLQKTLLNIEGLGRQLYPELDIWGTARPILIKILQERHGLEGAARDMRNQLPLWIDKTPRLPSMLFDVVEKAAEGRLQFEVRDPDREANQSAAEARQRRVTWAIFTAAFGISGSVMLALEGPGPLWQGQPVPGLIALGLSFVAGVRALRQ